MPDDFANMAEQMRLVATCINDIGQLKPAEGSVGHADRRDLRCKGLGATRPSLEAALLPAIFLGSAADHARGIAACIEADQVLFSIMTLIRPAMEATAGAHYMLDPQISVDERIRRWVNYRLAADVEMLRLIGSGRRVTEEARHPRERIDEIVKTAPKYQLKVEQEKPRGKLEPSRWIGTKNPTGLSLGQALLTDLTEVDASALLHRMTSAVIHGQIHGLTMFMMREEARDSGEHGIATVPFGLSPQHLAAYTAPVLWGLDRCMRRACEYGGHDVQQWVDVGQPALITWRKILGSLKRNR